MSLALILASLSAITWGMSDFGGGLISKRVSAVLVVLWSHLVGLGVGLVAAPLFGGTGLTGPTVIWGAVAGLAGVVGLISLYSGLASGSMAVVAPVSGVLAAAIPVFAGLLAGERPSLYAWLGILLAVPAIWLVSRHGDGSWGAGLGLGVAAGLGFGMFFVFLSFTPDDAGLWPLIPARVASFTVILVVVLLRRSGVRVTGHASWGIAAVGAGDMTANLLFLAAIQRGMLSLVGVVSSFYPVVTVLMARIFLSEKVGARRWIGIGIAVVSLALIAL